jgi:hypothetical protein
VVAFVASGEVVVHMNVIEVGGCGRVRPEVLGLLCFLHRRCGHLHCSEMCCSCPSSIVYALYMCCFFCILVMANFDFLKVEDNNHQNLLEAMSCNVHVLYFHLFFL